MFLPPLYVDWKDNRSAEWTLGGTRWLWFQAVVPGVVFLEQHSDALGTLFILFSILALFNQMFVEGRDLYDLLALPARSQHRALLPVVDINRLLVEVLIETTTEVANLLIFGLDLVAIDRLILARFLHLRRLLNLRVANTRSERLILLFHI